MPTARPARSGGNAAKSSAKRSTKPAATKAATPRTAVSKSAVPKTAVAGAAASKAVSKAAVSKTAATAASTDRAAATPKRGLRVVPGGRSTVSVAAHAPAMFTPDATVERLVAVLGNNGLARLLGVSPSQPTRWRSGKEAISPANRRRLSDLDHVLDRLLLELWPDQAGEWLTSPNAHLGGAVPVDVLVLRGAAPVLEAIDALGTGAFA